MPRNGATPHSAIRTRPLVAGLLVAAVLAAACGSTVQLGADGLPVATGSEGALALGTGDGMTIGETGVGPGGSTTTTPGTGGIPGSTTGVQPGTGVAGVPGTSGGGAGSPGSGGGSGPGTGGTGGGGQQPSGRDPSGGSAAGEVGPGVTAKEITIGVSVADGNNANQELLGASGITQGNQRRYWEIMRDQLNREGGIAGRDVRLSVFSYDVTGSTDVSRVESEACEYWSTDDRAHVVSAITNSDNLLTCLRENGLASTGPALMAQDDDALAQYPTHFAPSAMTLTSQMVNMTSGLVAQNYFGRGARLGVVTYDEDAFVRAVEGTLIPQLSRRGIEIATEVQKIQKMENTNQLAEMSAQVQSAVLKFKTDDITHVIIVEDNALLMLLFARSAENQDYRPRYGMNSQNGFSAIAPSVPQGQFNRAVGVGWIPTLDVRGDEQPDSPPGERCMAVYRRGGEVPADANQRSIMMGICEDMYFFKAAIEAGLPDITFESFYYGGEALGRSFPSFVGMGNPLFGPGHHAGVATYRHARYDPQCTCFHYSSKVINGR